MVPKSLLEPFDRDMFKDPLVEDRVNPFMEVKMGSLSPPSFFTLTSKVPTGSVSEQAIPQGK